MSEKFISSQTKFSNKQREGVIFSEFWEYLRTATTFDQSYTPAFSYDGLLHTPLVREENQAGKATQQPAQLTVRPSQLSGQSQLFPLQSPLTHKPGQLGLLHIMGGGRRNAAQKGEETRALCFQEVTWRNWSQRSRLTSNCRNTIYEPCRFLFSKEMLSSKIDLKCDRL